MNISDVRKDLADSFRIQDLEFPVESFVPLVLKDKAPEVVKKINDFALTRFIGYRDAYDELIVKSMERNHDVVRDEFITAWAECGKGLGKNCAPSIGLVVGGGAGVFGGRVLTEAVGPAASTALSTAMAGAVTLRQRNPLISIFALIVFTQMNALWNSAEAFALLSQKHEWPVKLGEEIGEGVGRLFGQTLTLLHTPRDVQAPDLSKWRIAICKKEIEALTHDRDVLDKSKEDHVMIKIVSGNISMRLEQLESILNKLEEKK